MSENVQLALITGGTSLLITLATLVVSLANNRKATAIGTAVASVGDKTNEIHVLTNANLSKVTESLNVALKEIDGLKTLVQSMTVAKAMSDTVAAAHRPESPVPVIVVDTAKPVDVRVQK